MTCEEIKEVFTKHLLKHHLYNAEFPVDVCEHRKDHLVISYQEHNPPNNSKDTHFSVNIIKDIFYILWINVQPEQRGLGFGNQLYELLADIAKECECKQIRQTPSGWAQTPSGWKPERKQTRAEYLQKRGWLVDGIEVYKDLK